MGWREGSGQVVSGFRSGHLQFDSGTTFSLGNSTSQEATVCSEESKV